MADFTIFILGVIIVSAIIGAFTVVHIIQLVRPGVGVGYPHANAEYGRGSSGTGIFILILVFALVFIIIFYNMDTNSNSIPKTSEQSQEQPSELEQFRNKEKVFAAFQHNNNLFQEKEPSNEDRQPISRPAPETPSSLPTPQNYCIQVVAVSQQADAETVANQYSHFLTAHVWIILDHNDHLFKVWVGNFNSRDEAKSFKQNKVKVGHIIDVNAKEDYYPISLVH